MHCARCGTWSADGADACPTCGAAPHPAGPLPAAPPAAARADVALRYGGFWRRTGAFLLDWCVLFFPEAIARARLGLDAFDSSSLWSDPTEWRLLGASLVLGLLYHSVLASSPFEGTLGQRAMDLRMADARGRRLSFARATWRWIASIASLFTCGFGWLLMLWTPRRQTLHDLLSGVVVVRAGREPDVAATTVRPAEAR